MPRPLILIGLLVLASGCAKPGTPDTAATTNPVSGGGDTTRPALSRESTPLDVVKDYLTGSGFGDLQVDSREERETTLNQKPATAVRLQWRGKDDTEPRTELFIIQGQRVKEHVPYNSAKAFEENVATAIHNLETP